MSRRIVLLGSRVVLGAWAKGRSSPFRLNGVIRQMFPYTLGARLQIEGVWVSTHANPVDFPSRHKGVPAPRVHASHCAEVLSPHLRSDRGVLWAAPALPAPKDNRSLDIALTQGAGDKPFSPHLLTSAGKGSSRAVVLPTSQ